MSPSNFSDRRRNSRIPLVISVRERSETGIVMCVATDISPCGMALKRGFGLKPGTRVLVVEDITTTGGSVLKTVEHLKGRGADVVGVSVLIDRSAGEARFDCRFEPLATLAMESWDPGSCELCARGLPLIEPDDLTA